MGYNLFGLCCGAFAVALFAVAHGWFHRQEGGRRRAYLALATLLAVPALYQALYYAHVLPETAWFYELRSWPGAELIVLPLGVWGGMVAAVLPRRVLVLPLLATTGAAMRPFMKPVLAPLPESEFREVWTKEVCIQSTLATCGPASLATI